MAWPVDEIEAVVRIEQLDQRLKITASVANGVKPHQNLGPLTSFSHKYRPKAGFDPSTRATQAELSQGRRWLNRGVVRAHISFKNIVMTESQDKSPARLYKGAWSTRKRPSAALDGPEPSF